MKKRVHTQQVLGCSGTQEESQRSALTGLQTVPKRMRCAFLRSRGGAWKSAGRWPGCEGVLCDRGSRGTDPYRKQRDGV